mmetsp:Transcript_58041/g.69200  ORF Transcript_58041/g.69200 Transcript_58041/m.69200 type:complete len:82 (+) Transcript_58041:296-541(+)
MVKSVFRLSYNSDNNDIPCVSARSMMRTSLYNTGSFSFAFSYWVCFTKAELSSVVKTWGSCPGYWMQTLNSYGHKLADVVL